MNWEKISGKWNEFKGTVREQWGKLTDDDLDRIEGRREQLVGRIQQLYGQTKEEVEESVARWERNLDRRP